MIDTLDELLERIQYRRLTERQVSNVELKRSWDQEDGKKISAFANRPTTSLYWICVGISDDGVLFGGAESWAKKTEETISQHINKFLDPQIACLGISCHEQGFSGSDLANILIFIKICPHRSYFSALNLLFHGPNQTYKICHGTTREIAPV